MERTLVGGTAVGGTVGGATGLLRAARTEEDAARISDFVCGLSPEARYLRFFASVAPPSTGLLRALSGAAGADVLLVTDGAGAVIAHGMAADAAPGEWRASNIGLVVTDCWQQQGLGGMLLSTLVARAARRGVRSLVLDVLPDNRRMLGIISRRWPDAPWERTPDAITIRPAITPRQATDSWPVPAIVRLPVSQSAIPATGAVRAPSQSAA
jgi:ribosomal protein S18 acetylase RimI-like enzyme